MILTAPDLLLLRERPHRTELYLSIYKPEIIMKCQVDVGTGSIGRGAMIVPYDTVSEGSYTGTFADLTILVGSSDGASDVGKVRMRTGTSSEFMVAENSDISWEDDLYLTVLNYVDIWTVYPRIIPDPSGAPKEVIFYKDYDISYSDQNTILGSFPCAGPHRAAFLENGIASLYYTATGTVNVNGETGTYLWEFEDGTPPVSTDETPGIVTYDAPGHHKTTLIVSTPLGGEDITHRFVSIYDRPENGSHTPILKWELSGLSGSRAEGGYTAQIKVWENINDIQDNALVVIFADDWYGNTKRSLGGNASGGATNNCSNIVFVGYVIKGTIRYNYRESSVEFGIGSPTEIMRQADGFAISCESKETSTTWFEIDDMTVPKAIYHYLHWHSTVLKVADFQYTGDNRRHQYFDTDRESLFDAIDNFLRTGLYGEMISDRQGKLWAEIDVPAEHNFYNSTGTTTMMLTNQDWIGEPDIEERQMNEVSYLEAGGIAYDGPIAGTFSALMSQAPGITPAYRGKAEQLQGLILLDQAQLNDLTGDIFAYKNSKYTVSMKLAGNYRNIDIVPKEKCLLNIEYLDTVRGIVFINKPFHPINMGWEWDASKGFLSPTISFNEITNGIGGQTEQIPAETVDIPIAPPTDGFSIPDIVIPSFSFPAIGGAEYFLLSKTSITALTSGDIPWESGIVGGDAIQWLPVSSPDTVTILKTGFYFIYVSLTLFEQPAIPLELYFTFTGHVEILGNFWAIPIYLDSSDHVPAGSFGQSYHLRATIPLPIQAGSTIKVHITYINGGGGVTTAQLFVVRICDLL